MRLVRLMTPYLAKHRVLLAVGIAGTIVGALISFSLGLAIKMVIDGIPSEPKEGYEFLNDILFGALTLFVLSTVVGFISGYSLLKVFTRVCRDLRDNIFSTLVSQRISYLERHSTGELQTRIIADTNIVSGFSTGQLPKLVTASISVVAGTVGALLISFQLTLIVLAALPFVFLPLLVWGRKIRDFGAKTQQQTAELGKVAGESFRSIKVVHVHNKEAEESSKFGQRSDALATTNVLASRLQMTISMSTGLAAQCALVVLLWTAAKGIYSGVYTVGELMAFAYFNGLIVSSAGSFFGMATALRKSTGSAERIMEYLSLEAHPWPRVGKSVSLVGAVEFRDVQFRYPARSEIDVLRGISFTVEAGTSTVIVGPSGAGKSAIFELLLGLYTPDTGIILIDGRNCQELGREQLRSSIGYVPQKESLLSGSVFDNIVYGADAADEARVVEAAKLACAHDFIMQLPQGYKTDLGEVAARLSGGEKQRISLARALVREPRILLLDEDKSALDADSERRVSDSVRKWAAARGTTVISIAHRLSSIGRADRIVVVEGGLVVGQGSHADLLSGCEIYRSLVSSYSREPGPATYEEPMPALRVSA
jgi:ATP-binding cassette, subfamily B, bacterial